MQFYSSKSESAKIALIHGTHMPNAELWTAVVLEWERERKRRTHTQYENNKNISFCMLLPISASVLRIVKAKIKSAACVVHRLFSMGAETGHNLLENDFIAE